MPLRDWEADPDYFEYDDTNHFSFPCVVCKHRHKKMTEDPCRVCGHNCCADDE